MKIAVFFVLTIHGVALLALLMQGCQKEKDTTAKADQPSTAAVAPTFDPTNTTPTELAPVAPATTSAIAEPALPVAPAASATGSEYVVVAGDNFSKIASKVKVPMAAVMAANPGVEPTKLHVGQKLHIPPAPPVVASASASTAPAVAPVSTAGGEQLYTVKSGDNLIKIGSQFGVSAKAIRNANGLKTDGIRVGQKLKIPGKVSGPAPNETAAAAPALPR